MIDNNRPLLLTVVDGEGTAASSQAVSLGLITTELVWLNNWVPKLRLWAGLLERRRRPMQPSRTNIPLRAPAAAIRNAGAGDLTVPN